WAEKKRPPGMARRYRTRKRRASVAACWKQPAMGSPVQVAGDHRLYLAAGPHLAGIVHLQFQACIVADLAALAYPQAAPGGQHAALVQPCGQHGIGGAGGRILETATIT